MPNWGKLLSAYAEGANPEAFARARAQREEMINNEQRRNLLASQEGRTQQEFEHSKGNWSKQDELLAKQLEAAGLSNEDARLRVQESKDKAEIRRLMGGNEGEAKRGEQEFGFKVNADKRADKALGYEGERVGISREQLKNEARRLGLSEGEYLLNKKAAEQTFKLNEEINPARVERAWMEADPRQRFSADVGSLATLSRSTNLDEDMAKQVTETALRFAQKGEKESNDWEARRKARQAKTVAPTAPPSKSNLNIGDIINGGVALQTSHRKR